MLVRVLNAQRQEAVSVARMAALARRTARRLGIKASGVFEISFIGAQRMRTLNRRFLGHDRPTDVLSFRYDGLTRGPGRTGRKGQDTVCGEVLIAPSQARIWARAHGAAYHDELSRYVVHGLLHWFGHEDHSPAQQRRMRLLEDRLLAGWRVGGFAGATHKQANRRTGQPAHR